jgi:hypothetical protein
MTAYTMPFGKYRGAPLHDLPGEYLDWLLTLDLRERLWGAAHREADRRRAAGSGRTAADARVRPCPAPQVAEELIGAGLRTLAKRHHPDAGGTHDAMIAATSAADWLRAIVRGLAA